MAPSEETLLGWVFTDKSYFVESTATKKKKHSDGSPKSSKRMRSSKSTSDVLKSLDEKWSKRLSRFEALLLSKSFSVPVEPVRPSTVVTREHPFFDPGTASSVVSSGVVTEGTGPNLVQTTGLAAQLSTAEPLLEVPSMNAVLDVSKSATRPFQGEAELDREPASPASATTQVELPEDSTDQDLSEEANYRETIRGVTSFMDWHQNPDFNSAFSSLDDNPFAGS